MLLGGDGVTAFDASKEDEPFPLRAYHLFDLGDIIVCQKCLGNKGHNALYPCRNCLILAIRDWQGNKKTHYTPLRIPKQHKPTAAENEARTKLKLRTHKEWVKTLDRMDAAETEEERKQIGKDAGLRQRPAFGAVGSIDYARSCPWDWMHVILENIIPNLFKLWSGDFKGLDEGKETYEIPPHIWDQIGQETAEAVKTIPASFVRVLKNIVTDRSSFTAETWCFWFLYLAPVLLKGRFTLDKYYDHMCDLVYIMKQTLKYSITEDELEELDERVNTWVEQYER